MDGYSKVLKGFKLDFSVNGFMKIMGINAVVRHHLIKVLISAGMMVFAWFGAVLRPHMVRSQYFAGFVLVVAAVFTYYTLALLLPTKTTYPVQPPIQRGNYGEVRTGWGLPQQTKMMAKSKRHFGVIFRLPK